jgi:hypothetical protein
MARAKGRGCFIVGVLLLACGTVGGGLWYWRYGWHHPSPTIRPAAAEVETKLSDPF